MPYIEASMHPKFKTIKSLLAAYKPHQCPEEEFRWTWLQLSSSHNATLFPVFVIPRHLALIYRRHDFARSRCLLFTDDFTLENSIAIDEWSLRKIEGVS